MVISGTAISPYLCMTKLERSFVKYLSEISCLVDDNDWLKQVTFYGQEFFPVSLGGSHMYSALTWLCLSAITVHVQRPEWNGCNDCDRRLFFPNLLECANCTFLWIRASTE